MSDIWASDTHAGGRVPWAWVRLLSVYGTATRQMDARLLAAHGLTLNDYEVLLFLSWAQGYRLKRVDLAERVLLTQSGITRLLEGLEHAGLVERARSETDGRVTYARLTGAGLERLREAARTHVADIHSAFTDHFSNQELATLAELLGRLPGGQPAAGGKRTDGQEGDPWRAARPRAGRRSTRQV